MSNNIAFNCLLPTPYCESKWSYTYEVQILKHFAIVLPSCGIIYILMSDIHTEPRAQKHFRHARTLRLVFVLEWGQYQNHSGFCCYLLIDWLCFACKSCWRDCILLTLLMVIPYAIYTLVMLPMSVWENAKLPSSLPDYNCPPF